MKYLIKLFPSFSILLIIISCQANKPMLSEGVSQGISGQVLWYEGDLMPGVDKEPIEGKPIHREVFIYEATNPTQGDIYEGVFYKDIKSKLVAKISTDENGKFIVELDPGTYSVFVKETSGLFANRFDQDGIINPITIGKNELTNMLIKVDYKAAY